MTDQQFVNDLQSVRDSFKLLVYCKDCGWEGVECEQIIDENCDENCPACGSPDWDYVGERPFSDEWKERRSKEIREHCGYPE